MLLGNDPALTACRQDAVGVSSACFTCRQEQAETAAEEVREELQDVQRELAHYEQELRLFKNLDEKYHAQQELIANLQAQIQDSLRVCQLDEDEKQSDHSGMVDCMQ